MKVSLYVLLLLLVACQPGNPTVDPLLFYKTWERQGGTYLGGNGGYSQEPLVTFRPNGEVLYGEQLSPGGCCRPTQFALTSNTLEFSGKGCPGVRCAAHELYTAGPWQILTLTSTRLIIAMPDLQLSYRAR